MALKDLKSDLSKFRMPKQDPLENKKIDEVNKKSNQTPLSSMVDSAPKIPRSQTTTNKEGVEPRKFDNSPNFLGETTPSKADNSEQFLGETTPTKSNLEERFLGETDPNNFDNSENFLGETTPTPANNESRFLGETDPNKFDNSSNFLGETTPSSTDNTGQFLGETTPSSTDNTGQFLGETTPTPANNQSQFLGETTPTPTNNQSQFLGETEPTSTDNTGQFLGETTPSSTNNTGQFLGETTKDKITQGDKEKGETTPTEFTFNPNHSDRGVTPTDVNNFTDIHALGFNSKFGGVESSKFIGVSPDNTVFDGTTSLYSNIDDSTFTLGRTYEQSFDSAGRLNSGEIGFGIGKGQAQRKSPSFLDLQYAKFNLKDDSFNTGLGLFRHPLILRGIQRKGISKGEPQSWGVLGVTFDDGLIRGGAITSTVRAAIDAARIGTWMLSVEGLLWSAKQLGLQQSNPNVETVTGKRLTKVWTPVNTLASVLGQHIGLHPRRHGILPLPEAVGPEKYENVQKLKARVGGSGDSGLGLSVSPSLPTDNRLVAYYGESFYNEAGLISSKDGSRSARLGWKFNNFSLGGTNSVYGLIPSGKFAKREFDTRDESILFKPDGGKYVKYDIFNQYGQYYSGNAPSSTKKDDELGKKQTEGTATPDENFRGKTPLANKYNDKDFDGGLGNDNPASHKVDANGSTDNTKSAREIIQDYTTLSYGQIREISEGRVVGNTSNLSDNDFRSKNDSEKIKGRAEKENWNEYNINTRVNFGNPGENPVEANRKTDRIEWWKTAKEGNRFDPINASEVGAGDINDLVHLWFQAEGGSKVQFRGTAKGITETFSPSWDSIKYNGRADQAYKYTTFERSLSFNFQVYATSRIDMKPIWTKLQYLSTMTMPQYGGDVGYQGTLVRFRLGSLYNNKLAFIESLSYNMSDETPWEISMLGSNEPIGELPMGIDVSIGLKILGDNRPQLAQTVYDWNF